MRENNEWDHQFVFSTTFEVISLELIKYSFILSYDHLQFALFKVPVEDPTIREMAEYMEVNRWNFVIL